jgi:hypothetical protein
MQKECPPIHENNTTNKNLIQQSIERDDNSASAGTPEQAILQELPVEKIVPPAKAPMVEVKAAVSLPKKAPTATKKAGITKSPAKNTQPVVRTKQTATKKPKITMPKALPIKPVPKKPAVKKPSNDY